MDETPDIQTTMKDIMSNFAAAVTVVTSRDDERDQICLQRRCYEDQPRNCHENAIECAHGREPVAYHGGRKCDDASDAACGSIGELPQVEAG